MTDSGYEDEAESDSEVSFVTNEYSRYVCTRALLVEHADEWNVGYHAGSNSRYSIELEETRGKEVCSVMAQLGWQLKDTFQPNHGGSRGLRFDSPEKVRTQANIDVEALLDEMQEPTEDN